MKIQKIERGIHTIELYACNLKYEQVQKVMDWLAEEKQLQIVQRDYPIICVNLLRGVE